MWVVQKVEVVDSRDSTSKAARKATLTKCTSTRFAGLDSATLLQLAGNHCVPSPSRYSWSKSKQHSPLHVSDTQIK